VKVGLSYIAKLPVRMAKAALAVPMADLDAALCLSAAARYMDAFAASGPALVARMEEGL
jgi:hypothetical protein